MNDILLVHPEQEMQLVTLLSKAGFYVQLAYSSEEAMSAIHRHQPAAVIIGDDPALPDGQELPGRLRAEFNVAIITLGSRDIYARTLAVENGSDLYLDDSVGGDELVARIQALVRRYQRQSASGVGVETARGTHRSQAPAGGVRGIRGNEGER